MELEKTRFSRPLVKLGAPVAVVVLLLVVSFLFDFSLFRVLLAIVTVLVAAMWVIARR